jgi:hypothetical protein
LSDADRVVGGFKFCIATNDPFLSRLEVGRAAFLVTEDIAGVSTRIDNGGNDRGSDLLDSVDVGFFGSITEINFIVTIRKSKEPLRLKIDS